jgi:hypothetical protein
VLATFATNFESMKGANGSPYLRLKLLFKTAFPKVAINDTHPASTVLSFCIAS